MCGGERRVCEGGGVVEGEVGRGMGGGGESTRTSSGLCSGRGRPIFNV